MEKIMDHIIKLDEQSYKKVSKNLYKHIICHLKDNPDIKLQNTQEIFAKALGFRNEHSLLNYFNKPTKFEARKKQNEPFFQHWNESDILFFLTSIFKKDDDLWTNRAISLLSTVIKFLVYMRDQKEILLNIDAIREYLILNNIIKLYKTRRDFPNHIRAALRAYLASLPGFQESTSIQSKTTEDQHSYLQMQFQSDIDNIIKMEKCDPIIFMPEWFHAIYSNQINTRNTDGEANWKDKELPKNQEKPKVVYKRLFENELDKFYSEFDYEEWDSIFSDNYHPKSNSSQDLTFKGINLIHPIARHSYYKNSWLADDSFQEILKDIVYNKDFKCFYLSDLILYSSHIVNQHKQARFMHYVQYLLNNYNTVVKYSDTFCELAQ